MTGKRTESLEAEVKQPMPTQTDRNTIPEGYPMDVHAALNASGGSDTEPVQ